MSTENYSQKNIRNFVISAHIDHGKSTLADRFLELTGTVEKRKMREQHLDMMELEREKGITIKLQPVRMTYRRTTPNTTPNHAEEFSVVQRGPHEMGVQRSSATNSEYVLNLIDTPGHVDFSYEVSRSLAAVEGVVLLVDATKGVQAQTLANLYLALEENLIIIPAVNKIDLLQARVQEVKREIAEILGIDEKEVFEISGKEGINVEKLLESVVEKIPPPQGDIDAPLRALIFDSRFDAFKGVVAHVRIVDGAVKQNEKIVLMAQNVESEVKEVGYFTPELKPTAELHAGEIGYIATGIKEPGKVRVGDTITSADIRRHNADLRGQLPRGSTSSRRESAGIQALPGYREPQPVVFMSFYPESADDFDVLKDALAELKLEDAALNFELEAQEVLGRGFRCGFLGLLHAEIISERLKREFALALVITSPSVSYKIIAQGGKETFVYSPQQWPQSNQIETVEEPWIKVEVMAPHSYLGAVHNVFEGIRKEYKDTKYFGTTRLMLTYEIPLSEMLANLYDKLKGATQGYASMNYEQIGYRQGDLVRLDILLAGEKEDAFSQIVPKNRTYEEGKRLVEKLKEVLPKQQFAVAIQAAIEGKIIARETLSAMRKDVTGYLYGGDYSRKRKLLEKQKKGKKELKAKGRVRVPADVFLSVLKSR